MKLSKTDLKLITECHELGSASFFTRGDQNKRKYESMLRLRDAGLIKVTHDRCEVQQVGAYGRRLNGWFRTYLCWNIKLLAGRVESD